VKVVVFQDVSFSYEQPVIENLSFEISRGEFIAVLGPNGSGKTTMLRLILGLLRPEKGRIEVFGYDSRERSKFIDYVGYLPQREEIFEDIPLSVSQVIKIPLLSKGKKVGDEKVREILSLVEMEDKFDVRFSELSGGQQQRVLLARALVNDPELILLDEPFNGVDIPSQKKIMEALDSLSSEGKTIIVVVHNINPVLHEVDRVILLNRKIVALGTPNKVFTEENIIKAYGSSIPLVICEEGYTHPLYGDQHG